MMAPRITLILALGSDGSVWFSLLQSNSNSNIMGLFFRHLVAKLDRERPNWRMNTVIQLDNVSN